MCATDWLMCNNILFLHKIIFKIIVGDSMLFGNNKPHIKKVLVDLSILKHINCGLGQIAYNYAKYFSEHADEFDFEIHLLVPKTLVGHFGDKVHYLPSRKTFRRYPFLVPRYDVWHSIHQLSSYMPFFNSTRNILTVHDLNFVYEKEGLKYRKALRKMKRRVNRADKIVAISNFAKTDLLRFFPDIDNVEVIYNGVEFTQSGELGQMPSAPFDNSRKFLFTIGQVMEKKNFHVLLDVMKLMPEYNLYIAGTNSTSYGDMIRERIESERISNVVLLGEILHEERTWLYSNCEAFVFPSKFEGFGLPVIEALSYGKPVISSRMTSLAEIGSTHVFFMDNFDADHIADRIRTGIREYAEHPELATASIEYARSFTYEKHIKRYLEIYRSLL